MSTQEFIFNTPLYQWVSQEDGSEQIVQDLRRNQTRFDGFNAQKGVESTYSVSSGLDTRHNIGRLGGIHVADSPFREDKIWYVTLSCGRYGDKIDLILFLRAEDCAIRKIGQYPSVADIHIGQIKQYKDVLAKEDLKEFTRAIGLAANGVGIGSFVYLRRIFEKLIFEASEQAIADGQIGEMDFVKLRMDEKIESINNYLPDTLVEVKQVYGILSKGIHELTEQECLAYFDTMRVGIELILDEKLDRKRKEGKKKQAMASMSKIISKIS